MRVRSFCVVAAVVAFAFGCSSEAGSSHAPLPEEPRDASVVSPSDASTTLPFTDAAPPDSSVKPIFEAPSFTTLYAASDIHGHYTELLALLLKAGLIAESPNAPTALVWSGGDATLVMMGDMIDKGSASLEVVEAMIALRASAIANGGTVVVTLGNHEAEFLGDPTDSKFRGKDRFDDELARQKPAIDPGAFASGSDPRAEWLRGRPLGAKIGGWFFSHAGDTAGLSVDALDADLAAAFVSGKQWNDPVVTGATSLLESRDWYTDPKILARNLDALGVKHIVFGHDPNAFPPSQGVIVAPATYAGGLIKIDTGLGAGYTTKGALLRVRHDASNEVAESLAPDGTVTPLWSGASN